MEPSTQPKFVSVPRKYAFSQEDKIRMGQCFNLAHAEAVAIHINNSPGATDYYKFDETVEERTLELFELMREIEKKIGDTYAIGTVEPV